MGLIIKELRIAGDKETQTVRTLFDTGASMSLIRKAIAEKVATLTLLPKPKKFKLGDGKGEVTATHRITLDIEINECTISDEILVLDNLAEEMIIGAKTMQAWRIKLDIDEDQVIIDPNVTELKLV
jgi:predicted aspartyl protease